MGSPLPLGRRTPTGRRRSVAALLAVAITGVLLAADARLPRRSDTVGHGYADWPGWGFTHTQYSADHGEDAAVRSVQRTLGQQPMTQAQAIMGWGVDNPEPSPDVYDFTSLDERMEFIRRSGGTPVITLCCAPDWMKGGVPGETDWNRLTEAPSPEHYADFAALSAVVARRYPYVRHFMVWNEWKGFFDDEENRWDAEGYTDLYNQVYDALKAVDPRNRVGGPYLDMTSEPVDSPNASVSLLGSWGSGDQRVLDAFSYWLAHKHGADFVVVDGHATTATGAADEFTALSKFSAVNWWIREQTDLPIWWSEWYVERSHKDWSPEHQVALRAASMIELAQSGASTVLYWNPRPRSAGCATCLWTDTRAEDGGRPLPFLTEVLQPFARWFPSGTDLRPVPAPPGLRVLAQDRAMVVVNTTEERVTATVDGQQMALRPYETRWFTAP
jgi:hypothetical protein